MFSKKIVYTGLTGAAALAASYGLYKIYKHSEAKKQEGQGSQTIESLGGTSLYEEQAKYRKSVINDNIKYELVLRLEKGTNYSGIVIIRFNLVKLNDIFIDFRGEQIKEFRINDQDYMRYGYSENQKGDYIVINKKFLNEGNNVFVIRFENNYTNDGNGLHSFVDEDGKQYIYSNAEPDYMHKIFPCFDQPDIRAQFQLTLILPENWVGISNEILEKKESFKTQGWIFSDYQSACKVNINEFLNGLSDDETSNVWKFYPTKVLSTYLYAIIAGQFSKIDLPESERYANIPMSIYCRDSLMPFLKKQQHITFNTSIEGIKFYEKLFGFKFPFSKYDHIYCPEYNVGAMENAGAITVNDAYIFKDTISLKYISVVAHTIAHELAHMWFGDLVTMQWWNGLWLNESFAEFVSLYCLMNIKLSFKTADWPRSNFLNKSWGYRDDQLSTTHPIACSVMNTEQADSIFDGITYSKGAAVVYQLLKLVGEEAFSHGMKNYFQKYQWKNTVLEDLIETIDIEFKKTNPTFDLKEWKKDWIEIAGLNTCIPVFNPSNKSKEASLKIIQGAALQNFPHLRNHKMKAGFFQKNGEVVSYDLVLKNQKETFITYDGSQDFQGVLLNYGDEAYIKVNLDEYSLKFFQENLEILKDELSRTMIWRVFYDMVRDGTMSSEEYIATLGKKIVFEDNEEIIEDALNFGQICIDGYTPINHQYELFHIVCQALYNMLIKNDTKSDAFILLLKSNIVKFAKAEEDIKLIYNWFNNSKECNPELLKHELTIYHGWTIVNRVHKSREFTKAQKEAIFAKQKEKDSSDEAKKAQKYCQGAAATMEERKELWQQFFKINDSESVQLKEDLMLGFNNPNYDLTEYHDLYFQNLLQVFNERPKEYAQAFAYCLYPISDDFAYLTEKIDQVLEQTKEHQILLIKHLKESKDLIQRKIKTYECFHKNHKN